MFQKLAKSRSFKKVKSCKEQEELLTQNNDAPLPRKLSLREMAREAAKAVDNKPLPEHTTQHPTSNSTTTDLELAAKDEQIKALMESLELSQVKCVALDAKEKEATAERTRLQEQIATLERHSSFASTPGYSSDGRSDALHDSPTDPEPEQNSPEPKAKATPLAPAALRETLRGHAHSVFCASFNSNGTKFATASKDKHLNIWDGRTGNVLHSIKAHHGYVLSCDFSDNDHLVATASVDRKAKIWSVSSGKKLHSVKHTEKVYCARFAKGSKQLGTTSIDKTAKVWSVETGKCLSSLETHTLPVFCCAFDPTGALMATAGDDHLIKVWDWKNRVEIANLPAHNDPIWSIGFSADGKRLVSASSGKSMKVWDLEKRSVLKEFTTKTATHNVQFIKNDKYFTSCGRDNAFSIWDSNTFELASCTPAHNQIVYHTAVHEDTILSTSLDSTVKVWDFPKLN